MNSEIIRKHLKSKHEEEEALVIKNFEEKYPSQPKFSPEVLNLQKKMEEHIKNKEYEKANETKIKIIQLCSEQDNKWKTEIHDKKLNSELEKLRSRHSNELLKTNMKIQLTFDEFQKKHELDLGNIDQRYKNKLKDLLNDHVTTENSFKKPSKGQLIKKIGNNTFTAKEN